MHHSGLIDSVKLMQHITVLALTVLKCKVPQDDCCELAGKNKKKNITHHTHPRHMCVNPFHFTEYGVLLNTCDWFCAPRLVLCECVFLHVRTRVRKGRELLYI